MTMMTTMPPAAVIQSRTCLRENGLARSFAISLPHDVERQARLRRVGIHQHRGRNPVEERLRRWQIAEAEGRRLFRAAEAEQAEQAARLFGQREHAHAIV